MKRTEKIAMPDRLKDVFFTPESIDRIADTIKQNYAAFDKAKFINLINDSKWDSLELKEKMRHTTICLHETLPAAFDEALEILKKAAPFVKGFELMCLPDFVELYGMENWDLSLPALGYFTKFASSEFAIRPFLDKGPERTMKFMGQCAEDEDEKVRRFASEGCRPRLPWAMALPKFKKDPTLIFPILEKLKNDPSENVRRSVANNLNDISKDNPKLALDIYEKWLGQSEQVDWIVKHACRTLLKAGNKRAMLLFGYGDPSHLKLENFKLDKEKLAIGETMNFSFDLILEEKRSKKIRLEYAVYFKKANSKLSKKVFKIAENNYKPGRISIKRKQTFIDMSTRKHYPGEHRISIIVNGVEKARLPFELGEKK